MTTYGKNPEIVRAIVEDRWDQATATPELGTDRGSGVTTSPLYDQLDATLEELAARVAGCEVAPFGMSDVMDELHTTIRERLTEWAIAYTLGETRAEIASERVA